IYAETDGAKHNSLSPIARKQGDEYIIDIILRNNITTAEYPDGVFHAHPEYHNIKKEGIGLIEAMGLFILPGRLKKQLSMIADILCGNAVNDGSYNSEGDILYVHRNMIANLIAETEGKTLNKEEAEETVRNKVNEICKNILINTAVFKNDEIGRKGMEIFLKSVGVTSE
ncbi:MAG: galactose-1-phosphate uridylyltransferase, partial [Clostridia bacterium]|nr:galactose-1-phosphate uridylyltransferase [Clostridia bacterium]